MTCIAWDGTTLAADSSVTIHGMKLTCDKLERMPDGSIYGAAGDGEDTLKLGEWLRKGGKGRRPKCDSVQALHIKSDGKIHLYVGSSRPEVVTSAFAAVGSGAKYAMAIMWDGGTAIKACEAAIALDKSCAGPITSLTLV